jgi:hypothetical protein
LEKSVNLIFENVPKMFLFRELLKLVSLPWHRRNFPDVLYDFEIWSLALGGRELRNVRQRKRKWDKIT